MSCLIMAGHTKDGNKGSGAIGHISESDETRKVAPKVHKNLIKLNCDSVYVHLDKAKGSNYLKEQVDLANAQGEFDCMVQIHFNCGTNDKDSSTTGCEVYYLSEKGKVFAERVDAKLSTLFKNRGVKQNDKLYWLRHTKCPAILIEVCFVDDKDDVKVYEENFYEVCKLIAEGLANKDFPEVIEKPIKYRIRTGGFTKEVAEEKMKYLEGLTGWWMTIKEQADGSYCILTGGFDKERAESKLATLKDLTGWWADIEENV